jgi:hypothetical protein
MSSDPITLNDAEAADKAFQEALEGLIAKNPALFKDLKLKIPQGMFRQIVRTFFYLGFSAGESNALSKVSHE